jgi:uncharacterized protein (TIGR03435 family)
MKFAPVAVIALATLMQLAHAQQPTADGPCAAQPRATFDVATIKPSDKPAGGASMHTRRDSMISGGVLRRLILFGYDLRDFQVTGGPDWVNTQVWEIKATFDPPEPEEGTLDEAGRKAVQLREQQRVQSLLADRFHFKCHFTTKELPIYELVPTKSGAKLTATTASDEKRHSISSNGNGRKTDLVATGVTLDELIGHLLSNEVGRTVVDKTGLTGSYDITLTWMPAMASAADTDAASGPTIFTALEEQLGLKLMPAKGPVQVLVIDSVEKPSEN